MRRDQLEHIAQSAQLTVQALQAQMEQMDLENDPAMQDRLRIWSVVHQSIHKDVTEQQVNDVIQKLRAMRTGGLEGQEVKIADYLIKQLNDAIEPDARGQPQSSKGDAELKSSSDPVAIVTMALEIGRGQEQYSLEEIRRAVELAMSPAVQAAFNAGAEFSIDREAQTVGLLLKVYVVTHDDIFGGSIRKTMRRVIPIPGMFQAIDFRTNAVTLAVLAYAIDAIRDRVTGQGRDTHLTSVVLEYCEALASTIRQLRDIGKRLASRKRDANSYSQSEYQSDLQRYEAAVGHYRELGQRLNRAFG